MDFVTPMANKLINENTSMQLSTLITKVRKAKTAAEERAIIKQESAYIRTVVGSEHARHAKRNLVKLMYIRMLGYPAEFGQVPCLDLITKGDYSAKRVGYLGLMLLLDETNETLMMVTNSLKTDLNRFQDPYILLNALTALANICSTGMANDLAPEVERLCDGKFLSRNNIVGPLAGHVRKKALLAAVRMVTRAPDVAEMFRDIPGVVIPDGNHAVVMGGVSLIQTLIAADSSGQMLKHFRTATVPGPAAQGYPALLTAVLSKLHHSKTNYEYTVSGICNPYLQVKVLKCLALLGKGSQEATDAMTDILAKVAAAHTTAQSKAGRVTRTTAGAVAMEAANTIMAIEPVPRLRSYAVQIMANFLKLSDNNMRYVALNTLLRSSATDLSAVQRHRSMIVECVKDPDSSIRKRALDLVYALVNDSNVEALSAELLAYLEVTDEAFKPSLTEHLCLLAQKFSPSTRWYIDQLLKIMVVAGPFVTENVSHALVVRVSNAEEDMHAYMARQALQVSSNHLETGSDLLLGLCTWAIGEYGDLLEESRGLLEGEEAFAVEGADDMHAGAVIILQKLIQPQHCNVHAEVVMAATKLLGRLGDAHKDALKAIVAGCATAHNVEVQQRACEVGQVLKLKPVLPPELIERIPPLDESTYAGNLQSDVSAMAAADTDAGGAGDLLGDLLGDPNSPVGGTGGAAAAGSAAAAGGAPRSVLDDLNDLLGGDGPAAAAAAPPPFTAWRDPQDGIEITFVCTPADPPPAAAAGAPATDILATYTNTGSAEVTGFRVLAAVPKGMTVEMKPAEGGDTLSAASANKVTQRMVAVNSTGGLKSLAMRLKVIYTVGGGAREHLGVVNNFPAGL